VLSNQARGAASVVEKFKVESRELPEVITEKKL
jgi:hypothetical protein